MKAALNPLTHVKDFARQLQLHLKYQLLSTDGLYSHKTHKKITFRWDDALLTAVLLYIEGFF